jgi:polynucleotide 5'-hydroxyl-kinase GRC3/NOL9
MNNPGLSFRLKDLCLMTDMVMEIPSEWEELNLSGLSGTVMVVGPADVGKSTFARYLFQRLWSAGSQVAYLDGDPGQSTLGPPGTLTLASAEKGANGFPPGGQIWRTFIGSVSPAGHMLPVLTGADRLVRVAREAGDQLVIYDTTGLVDPARGGIRLKLAKIDLLRPTVLFAIQRDQELRSLVLPLQRTSRIQVVELSPSSAAQKRDTSARKAHRAAKFASYFSNARSLRLTWPRFAVFPSPRFNLHRLLALEDADGFAIGLGLVEGIDRIYRQVTLHTPVSSVDKVDAIRLGSLAVDPVTYEDRPLSF